MKSEIKLFNTLSRQKEPFTPLNSKEVTLYCCGPTVYSSPTIANWRTYIFVDILKRTLEYDGYNVNHVTNITDVGHLVSDADEGEDKLEKAAKRERKTAREIADFYQKEFENGLRELNIEKPTKLIRATDYIQHQIDLIKSLEDKGFTYKISDGIYFDTSKFPNYGQLAKLDISGLKEGSRVEKNPEKKNATDFALWKFSPKSEKRDMEWESPWGRGFPGWHIECSAMAIEELGEQIDIHCGGIDLIPTHHTNEIAQSEAATGKIPFVKVWCHGEFMLINGGRMGKSLGNAYTLDDVVEKGFCPLDLRYYYYSANYRQKLNFTWEALSGAKSALARVRRDVVWLLDHNEKELPKKNNITGRAAEILHVFNNSILDDLNTSKALAALNSIVDSNDLESDRSVKPVGDRIEGDQGRYLEIEQRLATIREMDKILGLRLLDFRDDPPGHLYGKIPDQIQKLFEERNIARNEKNWEKADLLRKTIEEQGFQVQDSKDATKLNKT